ncbi:PH domain-containing protein [Bacillus sp. 165]|uniref:PH domain-containing protein n=1 Tax=Bacillus sp. 165 TaxID=1529117 RepID=UPI001ADB8297|nr:PH domain-containing protein [Bacillus sp. 165]MBO9128820.1 PH domain-containing protein [Bacillus sp. 165]
MYNQNRLHPAVILLNIGKYVRNLFPLYMIILFNSYAILPFNRIINTSLLMLTFLGCISIGSIISWKRFLYEIQTDQLSVEYGLFMRKRRFIPKERIQSIQEAEDIIHRIFGLVKLQIETAGGSGEPEVVLGAVTREQAEKIRKELSHHFLYKDTEEEVQASPFSFRLSPKELLFFSATSGGVGIALSAVVGLYLQIDDYVHISLNVASFVAQTTSFYIMAICLLAVSVWIIGILILYQKYYDFQVIRKDADLIITRGLIEKRKLIIPLQRIQAVKVEENIVRQWFGFVTIRLLSASGGAEANEELSFICFPIVKKKALPIIFKHYLPDYTFCSSVQSLPKRSLLRYLIRAMVPVLFLSLICFYFVPMTKYIVPFLLAASIAVGYRQFKDTGWMLFNQQLFIVTRRFIRTTILVKRSRIQSLQTYKSMFQDNPMLCTIKVYTKSGLGSSTFNLKDVDDSVGKAIREWYSYEKQRN